FFSSRRRHTRFSRDWSSDVCSSDLRPAGGPAGGHRPRGEATPVRPRRRPGEAQRALGRAGVRGRGIGVKKSGRKKAQNAQKEAEIGRASCRERGENRESAVTVKKQK